MKNGSFSCVLSGLFDPEVITLGRGVESKALVEEALPMTSGIPNLQVLQERISKLEEKNQRLKKLNTAILVLLSAVLLMGQSAPSPRVLEAQKFVLKDSDGNVRGWIGTIGKGSELILGNVNAQPMIRLIVSTDSSDLHFFGSRKSGMNVGLDSGTPDISMIGAEGNGGAKITFKEIGPSFSLEDAKGSSTIIGASQLEKPANHKANLTSAASIVLLDKDKNVIWQTP
jgi:hypothetical protein